MAKIIVNNTMESPHLISQKTKEILIKAADASKNQSITINSGIRSPQRQANAMYANLVNGNNVSYAAAGREVIAVYNANKGKSKEEVINLMVEKINLLYLQGKRTSLHCVPETEYKKLNVIDVTKYIPNPRDFCVELLKEPSVTRIITPFQPTASSKYPDSDLKSRRISVDANEPAIHIEIKQ